ncbi:MAG: hypothetical protein HGB01_06840 [Chlorobiaceae bacterium]|nr:hypothetical protein [Chlorobiaceae bacterium]
MSLYHEEIHEYGVIHQIMEAATTAAEFSAAATDYAAQRMQGEPADPATLLAKQGAFEISMKKMEIIFYDRQGQKGQMKQAMLKKSRERFERRKARRQGDAA